MFAPQTIPASPAVLMCRSLKPRILVFGFDSRGGLPIALSSYPSSRDFSSPLLVQASLGVRLYVSIVWGGSVTTTILPYQAVVERRGFRPKFLMMNSDI